MSEACSQRELPQRLKVQRQTKGSLNYKCYKNNSPDWSQIPSKTSRWLTRTKASVAWKCVNPELTEWKCWQMDGHHGGALGGWCFETQLPLNDFVLEKWFITAGELESLGRGGRAAAHFVSGWLRARWEPAASGCAVGPASAELTSWDIVRQLEVRLP